MNIIYGIRCHKYNEDIFELYGVLCKLHGDDNVILVCDESEYPVDAPDSVKKISIKSESLEDLNLPKINKWGWQCGDYFYYAMAEKYQRDYYWLIEPDVLFGGNCAQDFFSKLNNLSYDFLSCRHEQRDSNWYWHKTISPYSEKVFGCAFPVTRLSYRAIIFLQENRKKAFNSGSHSPNDEAFVSTLLEKGGYNCIDIEKLIPEYFRHFSTMTPLLKEKFREILGVHHPALSWPEFKEKYPEKLKSAINHKKGKGFIKSTLYGVGSDKILELLESNPGLFFEAFTQSK